MAYLAGMGIHSPSPEQYAFANHALGLDLPLFVQFFKYLLNLRLGDFGISSSVVPGAPVTELLKVAIPRMIEFSILPLLIGLALGGILGKIASRTRKTWKDKIIQLITSFGISIPIFFFGMLIQYQLGYKAGLIPTMGYKSVMFPDPEFRTGFLMLDSFLDGKPYLAIDIFYHYLGPRTIFMIATIALTTWQTRSYFVKKSHEKSAVSNTTITAIVFGSFLVLYFLVDTMFNLNGFGDLLLRSIVWSDFYLVSGLLASIIIMLIIVTFISNLIFVLFQYIASKGVFERLASRRFFNRIIRTKLENALYEENGRSETSFTKTLKTYLLTKLKSPYFIIGGIFVVFFIAVVNFPQLFTSYSFNDANGIFAGPWEPPSPGHPLGTGKFGRDVLARVIYGTRNSILFGVGAMLIGLITVLIALAVLIGVIILVVIIIGLKRGSEINFKFITKNLKSVLKHIDRWAHKPIVGLMILFYIFPGLIVTMLLTAIFGQRLEIIVISVGILLIPSFLRVIVSNIRGKNKIWNIAKSVIRYIPLSIAFAIIIYNSVGFLGFNDPRTINLGWDISQARIQMITAFHASYWPGLILTGIVGSFLLFHIGLQDKKPSKREFVVIDSNNIEQIDL